MEAAMDAMVGLVSANGGRMTFDDFKAGLSSEDVRVMPRALRELKAQNRLRKIIRVVDGRPVHEVYLPESSA